MTKQTAALLLVKDLSIPIAQAVEQTDGEEGGGEEVVIDVYYDTVVEDGEWCVAAADGGGWLDDGRG